VNGSFSTPDLSTRPVSRRYAIISAIPEPHIPAGSAFPITEYSSGLLNDDTAPVTAPDPQERLAPSNAGPAAVAHVKILSPFTSAISPFVPISIKR